MSLGTSLRAYHAHAEQGAETDGADPQVLLGLG